MSTVGAQLSRMRHKHVTGTCRAGAVSKGGSLDFTRLKSACSVLCRVHQPESCRETAKLAASSFGVNVNHSLEAKELEQAEGDPACSVLMALRWKVLEAVGQAQPWHPALCSSHPGIDRAAASGVGLHVSTEMEGIMLTEDLQRLRGLWQVPAWG